MAQPLSQHTDEQLVRLHRAGDADAFTALVTRYERELFLYLARYIGERGPAEDAFQETFMQVYVSLDGFDADRRFKPWLFTIATNKARDLLRRANRRPTIPLNAPIGNPHDERTTHAIDLLRADLPGPDEQLDEDETRRRVRRSVDTLAPPLREVLLLAYFERLAYKDIAKMLHIPLGTVKSRLHTAVAGFAAAWRANEPNDAGGVQ